MRKDLFDYYNSGCYFTVHPTMDIEELSLIIHLFLKIVGETEPGSMLEVGAANGFLVNRANKRGIFCIGVDISGWALRNSPKEVKGCLVHASATHLPFRDKCFQVVLSRALLEHIPEKDCSLAIRELERVGHKNIHHLTMAISDPLWRGGDETHVTIKPRGWWVEKVLEVSAEHWVLLSHEDEWEGMWGVLILNGGYVGLVDVLGAGHLRPDPEAAYGNKPIGSHIEIAQPAGASLKLNLGSGPNLLLDGWTNIDIVDMTPYIRYLIYAPDDFSEAGMKGMPLRQRELSQRLKRGDPIKFLEHDLRNPFPFPDRSVDLIYAGQLIEHFTPHEGLGFLRECWRVMNWRALMRLSTPDMDKLFLAYKNQQMGLFDGDQPAEYRGKTQATKLGYMLFGSLGDQREYAGHKMIYNFESLKETLVQAGFDPAALKSMECGDSQSPILQREMYEEHGRHSLFVEVTK